ncbi:RNA-guided endonuclease TnpB family protein [Phormidesmis sp. 146-33]
MARSKTPSFILELPLVVNSQADSELSSRFQAGRQLYNACLNEAMRRVKELRNSAVYQAAKKLPLKSKQRSEAFTDARKQYRFSDYQLQAFATLTANRSVWIAQKIDSNSVQTLATRAFRASERVLFGKAKNVRYKVPRRFNSIEGKGNKQGVRWLNDRLVWGKGFDLKPVIDWENPVHVHGLSSKVKYCRILKRELNGKRRWFVQLVLEGLPYQKKKNTVGDGGIGLDLNISNVAFVGDNAAGLLPFAENVPTFERKIKALQRQMQRSQRVSNPDNYKPNFEARQGRKIVTKKGKSKKGKRGWKKSQTYLNAARKMRELERRKTAYTKSQNRKLVNDTLRHGKDVKTEKVSVKGWQKRYGKAISAKSPGYFQSELKRKAESAGGSFTQFSTQTTALSQTHLTGERVKKSLSERVHYDQTGVVMQRDLFSAYLSRFVTDNMLDVQTARDSYQGSESILNAAWQAFQSASTKASLSSRESVPGRADGIKARKVQPDTRLHCATVGKAVPNS